MCFFTVDTKSRKTCKFNSLGPSDCFCLTIRLSVCLSVFRSFSLTVFLSLCLGLSVCLPVYLSVCLCLPVCFSIGLSTRMPLCISIYRLWYTEHYRPCNHVCFPCQLSSTLLFQTRLQGCRALFPTCSTSLLYSSVCPKKPDGNP